MTDRTLHAFRLSVFALLTASVTSLAAAQPKEAPKTAPKIASPAAESADPDVALAKKAALEWLALVDGYKFEATWDEAATSFQKGQTRADWAKGLGGARPTMGKLVSRAFLNHEIRTTLPNLPPGKYITIRFTSVFEKHKDGAESVTLIKDGARGFRMMSYFLK
jgi:Protein of unknown function (DUF4019)